MRVTPYGAVRTVTGSMHLVEAGGVRLLLDCGLFQGRRAQSVEVNSRFPFSPGSIDAVVLSHAHLDHCGNLPTLVREGFTGQVYCTPATRELTELVLLDSAKVQRQDATVVNRIRRREGLPPVRALYTAAEARRAVRRLRPVPYGKPFTIGGATIRFLDAGHILGSAITVIEAGGRAMGFTGDLGRPGAPILRDAEVPPGLDLLLCETTYGDRRHEPLAEGEGRLAEIVRRVAQRGGAILVPAFALGRTQDVANALHRLRDAGVIPPLRTFIDSPMAVDATEIFRRHPECFDEETRRHLKRHDPFGLGELRYARSGAESRALHQLDEPFIVIATSGMCESGRILEHLHHRIGDTRAALVIVSFQAVDTLGRRLADGVSPVRIYGEAFDVRLDVYVLPSFSAHADREELLAWLKGIPRVGQVVCVHGEEGQSLAFARTLAAQGFDARVPNRGEQISV